MNSSKHLLPTLPKVRWKISYLKSIFQDYINSRIASLSYTMDIDNHWIYPYRALESLDILSQRKEHTFNNFSKHYMLSIQLCTITQGDEELCACKDITHERSIYYDCQSEKTSLKSKVSIVSLPKTHKDWFIYTRYDHWNERILELIKEHISYSQRISPQVFYSQVSKYLFLQDFSTNEEVFTDL